jgi:hypothetical protein
MGGLFAQVNNAGIACVVYRLISSTETLSPSTHWMLVLLDEKLAVARVLSSQLRR